MDRAVMIQKLHVDLETAEIPINGVGDRKGVISVYYKPEATKDQIQQGEKIVAEFDWTEKAYQAWIKNIEQEKWISELDNNKLIQAILSVLLAETSSIHGKTYDQLLDSIKQKIRDDENAKL